MNIYILPIVNLLYFIYVPIGAQGEENEPLAISINKNGHGKGFLQLPFADVPRPDNPNVIWACPAETETDQKYIEDLTKDFYKFGYCLFERKFQVNQPRTCQQEVKPMLSLQVDEHTKEPIRCGPKKKYKLYEFGYYYCKAPESIRRLHYEMTQKKPKTLRFPTTSFFPIYDLCIDSKKGFALWTKHRIMKPAIYLNPRNAEILELQKETDPPISTDALIFEERRYIKALNKYKNQKKNVKYKMYANLMVPSEHLALKMWRKTTNHYMVAAPLWEGLKNLMNEFNEAMKKLALDMYRNEQLLTIYTKFENLGSRFYSETIWYKLLYEEISQLALLVVIKNPPLEAPNQSTKVCDTQIDCEMQTWFEKEVANIPPDAESFNNYAFCCKTSTGEVLRLFNIHLDISGQLGIDDAFKRINQQSHQLMNWEKETNHSPDNVSQYANPLLGSPKRPPTTPTMVNDTS